jgi:hypothetical protein
MSTSNYPPGVTDSMIPGNRPEDEEIEIVLTRGEIQDLMLLEGKAVLDCRYDPMLDNIKEQLPKGWLEKY